MKLLAGKYNYSGKISASVNFDYFPFKVSNRLKTPLEVAEEVYPGYERWKLEKEISLLDLDNEILNRSFNTLSNGEQTKLLLAILFFKENNFLLIDEPTNHLDEQSREAVTKYLKNKRGFILVSHDRKLLDSCIDHVLSINKTNIEVQQGNFSSWWKNKKYKDNFELAENEKLKRDIEKLEKTARQSANWSNKAEKTKFTGKRASGLKADRGFVGHKAAKMMKRSISAQNRKEKAIRDKSKLLKNFESVENLKLNPIKYEKDILVKVSNLSIFYKENKILSGVSFQVKNGDRVQLSGKNGCGKSSILKLIIGKNIKYSGELNVCSNLKISYVPQNIDSLNGNLKNFATNNNIDESLFKAILRKLDFSRDQFNKNIEDFSSGQKKKVLIAKSLCEKAHLYIWDEPLNFIDVISRIQIEDLILKYSPTMVFIEHDKTFSEKIATKIIKL